MKDRWLQVRIDEETKKKVSAAAASEGRTVSSFVLHVISLWLQNKVAGRGRKEG
jgi:uncharacterized protein (DUF1778 family)